METWIVIGAIALLGALARLIYWMGQVDTDRTNFKKFMERVEDKIDQIFERLPKQTTATESSIRLTGLGQRISLELGASEWAGIASLNLVERYRGLSQSAYEIQERCFRYAKRSDSLNAEMTASVLDSAYRHGLPKDKVLMFSALSCGINACRNGQTRRVALI